MLQSCHLVFLSRIQAADFPVFLCTKDPSGWEYLGCCTLYFSASPLSLAVWEPYFCCIFQLEPGRIFNLIHVVRCYSYVCYCFVNLKSSYSALCMPSKIIDPKSLHSFSFVICSLLLSTSVTDTLLICLLISNNLHFLQSQSMK